MRNLLLTPFVLALVASLPACSDDDDGFFDDADAAAVDGDFLGSEHAREIDVDFAGDVDEIIVGKSAAIMTAINDNEIATAELALDTAIDPIVLGYAQLMIQEHEDNQLVLDNLLLDFDIDILDNPVSDALRAEGAGVLRNLDLAFDIDYEYIRSQIVAHAEAFVIVDTLAALSPFVEFTQFYDDTLTVIDDHQIEAELILRGL
jgi:predicted outer membrane protein